MCLWFNPPIQKWDSDPSNPLVGYKILKEIQGGPWLRSYYRGRSIWKNNKLRITQAEPAIGDGPGIYVYKTESQVSTSMNMRTNFGTARSRVVVRVILFGPVDEYGGVIPGYKAKEARITDYWENGRWKPIKERKPSEQ